MISAKEGGFGDINDIGNVLIRLREIVQKSRDQE